jgi:flagellar protein FlaG
MTEMIKRGYSAGSLWNGAARPVRMNTWRCNIMGIGISFTPTRLAGLPREMVPGMQMIRAGERRGSAPERVAGKVPGRREILDVTRDLEQISLSFNRKLQFVVDHESNEISVKVIDRATDKVIKVLPPEELQRLHSRIEETIGFLFDETV